MANNIDDSLGVISYNSVNDNYDVRTFNVAGMLVHEVLGAFQNSDLTIPPNDTVFLLVNPVNISGESYRLAFNGFKSKNSLSCAFQANSDNSFPSCFVGLSYSAFVELCKYFGYSLPIESGGTVDLTEINTKLDSIQQRVNNLVGFDFSGSLNGTSGSYPDDTKVSIEGYEGEYSVSSSNVMKYDDNLHILIYRCLKDDKYFNVPSNMVSLYVDPTP